MPLQHHHCLEIKSTSQEKSARHIVGFSGRCLQCLFIIFRSIYIQQYAGIITMNIPGFFRMSCEDCAHASRTLKVSDFPGQRQGNEQIIAVMSILLWDG